MDATLLRDLQTWDERRADDFPESPWLLPTRTGGQVTRQHLYRVVKRMADRAGLPEPLPSPHDLRHTLGTWLYRETHDLVKVAKTLGHSDTTTAEIYTHLNGADVEDGLSALADSRADEDGSADGPADDGHGAENVTLPTSVPAVLPPPAGVRSSTSEWQRARGPGSAARTDQPATPSAAGPSRRPPGPLATINRLAGQTAQNPVVYLSPVTRSRSRKFPTTTRRGRVIGAALKPYCCGGSDPSDSTACSTTASSRRSRSRKFWFSPRTSSRRSIHSLCCSIGSRCSAFSLRAPDAGPRATDRKTSLPLEVPEYPAEAAERRP